jgi:hypothetical protein
VEIQPDPGTGLDARQIARWLACGRIAVGAGMTVLPGRAGGTWFGAASRQPIVKTAVRALGVRDALIGVGTLRALEEGEPVRPWLLAGALADGVDAVATVVAYRHLPKRRRFLVLAIATTATVANVLLADQVEDG